MTAPITFVSSALVFWHWTVRRRTRTFLYCRNGHGNSRPMILAEKMNGLVFFDFLMCVLCLWFLSCCLFPITIFACLIGPTPRPKAKTQQQNSIGKSTRRSFPCWSQHHSFEEKEKEKIRRKRTVAIPVPVPENKREGHQSKRKVILWIGREEKRKTKYQILETVSFFSLGGSELSHFSSQRKSFLWPFDYLHRKE